MNSAVKHRIPLYLTEAEDYYFKGTYDKCIHKFQLLREELNETKSLTVCSMDKYAFSCLIDNNILISKSLVGIFYNSF
jgi:hypothetical protein